MEPEEPTTTPETDEDEGPRHRAGDVDATAARAGLFAEPWLLAAGLCVAAAAACLVLGFYDAAFVAAALGVVAWFLNVRAKLPRPPEDDEDDEDVNGEP